MLPKYKDIVDLMKKGSTIEAQEQIMALREGALELQEENLELKEKLSELEKSIKELDDVIYDNSCYWKTAEEDRDGPFCQRCYDVDNNLVRLQGGKNEKWNCRECDKTYYGKNYVRPSATIPFRR